MSTRKKPHRKHIEDRFTVIVRLLEEGSEENVDVPENATGKWLLDEICRQQNIIEEKEYFGLRYLEHDLLSPPTKQWICLSRSVFTQLKNTRPRLVSFRFKHYPADPLADLRLPKTHYLLYQQLRRDLLSGRLAAADDVIIRLAALVLQVELGDHSVQDPPLLSSKSSPEHTYVHGFKVLHNQNLNTELQLVEEHKKLEGLLPSEAAMEMIEVASRLDTYGIDPVRVKTKTFGARPIHLGLTHRGVAEFLGTRCQAVFSWSDITGMTYDGRYFVITISKMQEKKKKTTDHSIRFKCESKAVARALWEWAADRQLFMTLERSSSKLLVKSKRSIFSRSHTFRFSGRCRREIIGKHQFAATLPSAMSSCLAENATDHARDHLNGDGFSQSPGELPDMIATRTILNKSSTLPAVTEPLNVDLECSNSPVNSRLLTVNTVVSEPHPSLTPESLGVVDGSGPSPSPNRLVRTDQLVPYFGTMPRRRYTPDSQDRQNKLVQIYHSPGAGPKTSSDEYEWSAEAAIAELRATVEAGQAWADEDVQYTKPLLTDPVSNDSATLLCCEEVSLQPPPPRRWPGFAVAAGICTGISVFGLVLILEAGSHSLLREHPWILDLDARVYRPIKSALFGLWRRSGP